MVVQVLNQGFLFRRSPETTRRSRSWCWPWASSWRYSQLQERACSRRKP